MMIIFIACFRVKFFSKELYKPNHYFPMNIKEYLSLTKQTAIYPPDTFLEYLTLGLASEAGEVSGVVKKYIRQDFDMDYAQEKLKKELGDLLWYWARLCDELGLDPEDVMETNINKLLKRKENKTLQGDGDDR
jgi:NTP pyrophosphatase (non-canonical NTP hydrolase)